MVTIAFGQVFYFIAFRWNAVTGGDDGLTGWGRQPKCPAKFHELSKNFTNFE